MENAVQSLQSQRSAAPFISSGFSSQLRHISCNADLETMALQINGIVPPRIEKVLAAEICILQRIGRLGGGNDTSFLGNRCRGLGMFLSYQVLRACNALNLDPVVGLIGTNDMHDTDPMEFPAGIRSEFRDHYLSYLAFSSGPFIAVDVSVLKHEPRLRADALVFSYYSLAETIQALQSFYGGSAWRVVPAAS